MVGYARVSSVRQELTLQLDAFALAGVAVVFTEKRSGVVHRPELQKALSILKSGDVLCVWKLDRMARSLYDLLQIIERLNAIGASFRSLTEPLDTSSPLGVFVLQILGSVAQLERSMIRERAIAGQVAAYRRGVRWGGSLKRLTPDDEEMIRELRATGFYTVPMLATIFEVSISTIDRALGRRASKPKTPVLGKYLND